MARFFVLATVRLRRAAIARTLFRSAAIERSVPSSASVHGRFSRVRIEGAPDSRPIHNTEIKMLRTVLAAALLCACLSAPARAETCIASWYGGKHHGRLTASGARFNQHAMTAAHRTRPFGSRAMVTHAGRSVTVTITDRGPFVRGRCIDLSRAAAQALGINGVGRVEVR